MGTRCLHVEQFLRKEKPHKHLVLVLNKVDLVPTWVTKKWLNLLSSELPTVAFHASIHHSFGKGALINLLRQFSKLHSDKQQVSVGLIGYPNVGKSSVINTLRSKKVCKTAPIAGETKVWQYITLIRKIYLIDCPGIVYPQGDTETDLILKGVVRVENVKDPENHIHAVLNRVKKEHLVGHYSYAKLTSSDNEIPWKDAEDFLTKLALGSGRLLRGGEPDLSTVAKMVLNDFQRGNLPHYVSPPGCESGPSSNPKQTSSDPNSIFAEKSFDDQLPINKIEEDEKDLVSDFESEGGVEDLGSNVDPEEEILKNFPKDESNEDNDASKEDIDCKSEASTDVEFLLSGSDDESIGSEFYLSDADDRPMKSKQVSKNRLRGKRAGKKLAGNRESLKKTTNDDFSSKKNLWLKKPKKKNKKDKHQK